MPMTNQGPRRHRRRLPGMHSVRPCTRTVETQPSPTHPPVEPNPQVGVSHYRGEAAGPDAPARKPDARDHSTRWSNGPPPAGRPAPPGGFRQPAPTRPPSITGPRPPSPDRLFTPNGGSARRARSGLGSHPRAEVAPGFGPVFVSTRDAVRDVAVPVGHPDAGAPAPVDQVRDQQRRRDDADPGNPHQPPHGRTSTWPETPESVAGRKRG